MFKQAFFGWESIQNQRIIFLNTALFIIYQNCIILNFLFSSHAFRVKSCQIFHPGYFCQNEAKVTMIKSGHTYVL